MTGAEYKIQIAIVDYLLRRYPDVEFRADLGGIRLTRGLAVKAARLNGKRRAWPDMFIAEPRGKWCGLFIEIKASRSDLYCVNGDMRKDKHVIEQSAKLDALMAKGYLAVFCCGLDEAIKCIDTYLLQAKKSPD